MTEPCGSPGEEETDRQRDRRGLQLQHRTLELTLDDEKSFRHEERHDSTVNFSNKEHEL